MLSCPDPLIVASSHLISCSVPSFTQQFYTHTLIHNSYSNTAHTDHSSEGSACCSRSIGLVEAQHGDNMTEAAAKFLTAQIGVTPVAASIRALDTLLEEAAGGRCGACQVVVEALVDEIDLWEQVCYDPCVTAHSDALAYPPHDKRSIDACAFGGSLCTNSVNSSLSIHSSTAQLLNSTLPTCPVSFFPQDLSLCLSCALSGCSQLCTQWCAALRNTAAHRRTMMMAGTH